METVLERLQHEISLLQLDQSLLALNRLLAASRDENSDPHLEPLLRARKSRAPAFVIHFLAKQLLLHSSNLGIHQFDGRRFHQLMDLYCQLNDPICTDPAWPTADPSGFFERMLAQQLPSQGGINLQPYGLALGMFRDVGCVSTSQGEYDIRHDIEAELGMSIEEFMQMGILCMSAQMCTNNGYSHRGTFDHIYFALANLQGLGFSRPELWAPFLCRVARDRDGFRQAYRANPRYQAREVQYAQFEFNPLLRYPVSDLGQGRHLAVDPQLLPERTTLGLFYDLFERDGTDFSARFGYVFDRFIGNLLGSVLPDSSLWWESDPNRMKAKNEGKVADWVYRGGTHTILFECKSLRPSLELVTYGSDASTADTRRRIVEALVQLIRHNDSIQSGKWTSPILTPRPVVGVVVTYGRIYGANGPFMRPRIAQDLAAKNLTPIPYIVLSVEELDHVIRLVELGHQLDTVLHNFATGEPSFDLIQRYASSFMDQQGPRMSAFSFQRGQQFMDGLTTCRAPQTHSDGGYAA